MDRTSRVAVLITTTAVVLVVAGLLPATASATTPSSAPTITDPSDGAVVSATPLSVTATTASDGTVGAVRFVIDGRAEYTVDVPVTGGVATGLLPVAGLDGTHSLEAMDCASAGTECNDAVTSTPISITVALPAPTVVSPAPGTVVGGSVTVTAGNLAAAGVQFLVDGSVVTQSTTATKAVSLAGLPDGTHQLQVQQCNAAATVCEGAVSDPVRVVKDTRGPHWSQVRAAPRTVYPARDRYQDTTRLTARVGERAHQVRVVLRNGSGRTVRTWSLAAAGPGDVGVVFDGRAAGGSVLPSGRYRFTFTGKDRNGRASTSRAGVVTVSDKVLVSRTTTRTVTAIGSGVQVVAGACSGLYRLTRQAPSPYFKKGIGYYSNITCHGSRKASVAAVYHGLRLAPAVRYGSVTVEAYGAAASRHGGPAFMYYVNQAGDLVAGRTLGSSLGWHAGRRAALSHLYADHALFWLVGTMGGHWYNVGSFRVTYTRFLLQSP